MSRTDISCLCIICLFNVSIQHIFMFLCLNKKINTRLVKLCIFNNAIKLSVIHSYKQTRLVKVFNAMHQYDIVFLVYGINKSVITKTLDKVWVSSTFAQSRLVSVSTSFKFIGLQEFL